MERQERSDELKPLAIAQEYTTEVNEFYKKMWNTSTTIEELDELGDYNLEKYSDE